MRIYSVLKFSATIITIIILLFYRQTRDFNRNSKTNKIVQRTQLDARLAKTKTKSTFCRRTKKIRRTNSDSNCGLIRMMHAICSVVKFEFGCIYDSVRCAMIRCVSRFVHHKIAYHNHKFIYSYEIAFNNPGKRPRQLLRRQRRMQKPRIRR